MKKWILDSCSAQFQNENDIRKLFTPRRVHEFHFLKKIELTETNAFLIYWHAFVYDNMNMKTVIRAQFESIFFTLHWWFQFLHREQSQLKEGKEKKKVWCISHVLKTWSWKTWQDFKTISTALKWISTEFGTQNESGQFFSESPLNFNYHTCTNLGLFMDESDLNRPGRK